MKGCGSLGRDTWMMDTEDRGSRAGGGEKEKNGAAVIARTMNKTQQRHLSSILEYIALFSLDVAHNYSLSLIDRKC